MDSLKVAAEKIKKSPQVMRKKLDNALNRERLNEDWILNRENVLNGVTFNMKLLGQLPANNAHGQGCTDEGVEKLVQRHKQNQKTEKLRKVAMTVDSKNLVIRDILTKELIENFPIHQVSYCTSDPKYHKVFAMVARQKGSKELLIYAFLTNRKSMAEAISLTVAQGFTMAYEEWEEKMKLRKNEIEAAQDIEAHEIYKSLGQTQKFDDKRKTSEDAEKNFTYVSNSLRFSSPELTVDSAQDDCYDVEDGFLSLAKSRTKELDTGFVRKNMFKGDVKDFLDVNNTYHDLVRAASTEDLFSISTDEDFFAPTKVHQTARPKSGNGCLFICENFKGWGESNKRGKSRQKMKKTILKT